ncbi:MAG TPA: DUF3617 family protein [Allosphingosinicella sp.]|nr:DUF3617 family protein [Allosphingosinicella sp.]
MRILTIVPFCLVVAACSGDETNNQAAQAVPESLPAGTWHAQFEVTSFASTDNSKPALKAKVGDKEQDSNCVTEAQRAQPAPELFVGSGYSCTYKTSYIKDGMINASLTCTRPEFKGEVAMSVQGSYTANGFEGTVDTNSYFPGTGDFTMSRKFKAVLTPGVCQPSSVEGGHATSDAKESKGG